MRTIIMSLLLCSGHLFATEMKNGTDTIFGVKWGSSSKTLISMGISLKQENNIQGVETYTTSSMAKSFSTADEYILKFYKDSLVKVIVFTKEIEDDPYGTAGLEIFSSLQTMLDKNFTRKNIFSYLKSNSMYNESDEFYQSLKYDERTCISFHENAYSSLVVEMIGLGAGRGYIRIMIESNYWSVVVDKIKKETQEKDSDAF